MSSAWSLNKPVVMAPASQQIQQRRRMKQKSLAASLTATSWHGTVSGDSSCGKQEAELQLAA